MAHVLVPYDGSGQAQNALEFACETFDEDDLTVLFVVDTSITFEAGTYVGMKLGEIYERREEEGKKLLEEASDMAAEYGRTVETVIKHGEPSKAILKQIDERDVDHVVTGSHSQGPLERFFLGSVAERVVERSPVSVTVIRS
jgi:nucleotide-binding universal stress UspA family protein